MITRTHDGAATSVAPSSKFSRARQVLSGVSLNFVIVGMARGQCMSWDTVFSAGPNGEVAAMEMFDSGNGPDLYVGGYFGEIINGPWQTYYIAKWNGSTWSAVGGGANDELGALHVFDDGTGPALYLGGAFTTVGGTLAYRIARWDGLAYSPLGPGLEAGFQGANPWVSSLATFDDGSGPTLYAAGYLPQSNGVPINHIARWDGSQWRPLGSGLNSGGYVYALKVFDDGSGPALFVGGNFSSAGGLPANGFAKWNGATWTPVGVGVLPAVSALEVWDDGGGPALFIATGTTTIPGGGSTFGIVKWDGTTWSEVGGGTNQAPSAFAVFDDGTGPALFAGGWLTQAGNVPVNRIAKWDGSQWSALGNGIQPGALGIVYALGTFEIAPGQGPDLYVGGWFTRAASNTSYNIARWLACDDPIDTFCFGDGTLVLCPCQDSDPGPPNMGDPGHGCNNSLQNGGARLAANGSPVPDTVVLRATNELPTALTIFLQGNQVLPITLPFGDGLRCIGGTLKRLYTKSATAGAAMAPAPGDPSVTARSAALGDPIAPGSSRFYQTYYRDPNPNVPICVPGLGGTFNSSNGVRVAW